MAADKRPGDRLSSREGEAVREAYAKLRAFASLATDPDDRRHVRECCDRMTPASLVDGLLTSRELDVLAQAATGLCNREIAQALGLSAETVKAYLRSARTKLGAHGRHETVVAARRVGLLP